MAPLRTEIFDSIEVDLQHDLPDLELAVAVDLDLIDGVPRVFLERLEDVFDNSNKLYLQIRMNDQEDSAEPLLQHLRDTHDLDEVITVLNDKGIASFYVGIMNSSRNQNGPANQRQVVVANDQGDAILRIKQGGFMGARYEISGAGILGFNLRRTIFGSYVAFDKWKNLFKIHSWSLALTPKCCRGRRRTATVNIRDLDGTWTGAMAYNVPRPVGSTNTSGGEGDKSDPTSTKVTSITFSHGLNRKAKYIMFAACLIPFTSHFGIGRSSSKG